MSAADEPAAADDARAAKAAAPGPGAPPEDPELHWLKNVYRGGVPQLTIRSVITGMLLGGVMCLSNLYVVLKTGWSLAVTVTAVILAFALFSLIEKTGLVKRHFTLLENNAMGSVASAAGYMSGGGNMAAIPALFMLTGFRPSGPWMFIWFAVIAALGVFAAIPIKRQLINIERLPFPTGIATAETLVSLHGAEEKKDAAAAPAADGSGRSANEGRKKASWLTRAAGIGAVIAFFRDAKGAFMPFNLPGRFDLPFGWGGRMAKDWSISLDGSLILMGAGAIMGIRVCASILLGVIINYGIVAPAMFDRGVIKASAKGDIGYKAIVQFSLWPAASMLLVSGLLAFAFQWRSIAKSFAVFRPRSSGSDPLADVECPAWWAPAGFLLLGPVIVYLMWKLFGIPWWAGIVALPLAMAMGMVASRVTGETDVTPTKALGPATQLAYGAMVPGNLPANIMGANVTGGVGLHAADLLTDLKSGYLVGANPRQQFFAQLFGVVAGAAVVVPAFNLLIPSGDSLGGDEFPAPSVQVWKGVSQALVQGISTLPYEVKIACAVAGAVGAVLAILEQVLPKRLRAWVPTPSGVGIAFVIPGYNGVAMFMGAAIAELVKEKHGPAVVPVASGFIAGESLMGIGIAILVALGVLSK